MIINKQVILVTGGNGIIGKAIISYLSEKGYICINADITNKHLPEYHQFNLDVTDTASIDSCIKNIFDKYGVINGLVNAAYPRTNDWGNKFEEIEFASWKKNVDLQLNSVFYICQKILVIMKKQHFGSIVNISSIYGIVGPDFSVYDNTNMTMPAAYSAIKGGIINFTKYLASYFGKDNIRINCVSPGGVFAGENPEFVKNYEKKVPLKRMATPEDIAPAVEFLISNESKYITGHNLVVDGGWTAI